MAILVTCGAGFIGRNFVLHWLARSDEPVFNLDKLTCAGNLENFASLQGDARHILVQGDLGDRTLVDALMAEHRPRAVLYFAAESHLDRSIHGPEDLIQTNIVGTFRLLAAARAYWACLPEAEKAAFRFLHISTDEVYGSSYTTQITHVQDRPGHDRRYAIDAGKIERELGWKPAETFEAGIRKTVQWYPETHDWVQHVQNGYYRDWVSQHYGEEVAV